MSISLSEESIAKVQAFLKKPQFRNKSHVVEYAISKLVEEASAE